MGTEEIPTLLDIEDVLKEILVELKAIRQQLNKKDG